MPGLLPHIRYADALLHIGTKPRLTPEHFLFSKKKPRSLYPGARRSGHATASNPAIQRRELDAFVALRNRIMEPAQQRSAPPTKSAYEPPPGALEALAGFVLGDSLFSRGWVEPPGRAARGSAPIR
jgi:hypothetical protein